MSDTYLKLPPWAKTAVRRHPFIVGMLGAPVGVELAGGTLAALISVGLLGIIVKGVQYLPVLKDITGQTRSHKNSAVKPRLYKKAA
jgi:hypothetical protein